MGSLLRASLVVVLVLGVAGHRAHAGPKAEKTIRESTKKAMEHFDMLEYELAKKLLLEAIVVAKKNDMENSRAIADTYLYLGIVHFAGFEDEASAKLAFMDAVRADPGVSLDIGYRTREMQALLDEARSEIGPAPAATDCGSLDGVAHDLVDFADPGSDVEMRADVGGSLDAHKVVLHYRPDGAADFKGVTMERSGECGYRGAIPGKNVKGSIMHYFIAAHDKTGRVLAGSGSKASPHLIEINGALDDVTDENPFEIEKPVEVTPGADDKTVFIGLAVGSGGGYVSGFTEDAGAEVGCCFAPALFHAFPELGFYFSPQLSVSVAGRLGFPFDANREGHSTAAPSALLRFRYALAEDGNGFTVNGALGGGVIRHTVQLSEVPADEGNVDTSASGPLMVGAGAGLIKPLGGPAKFVAEVNAIAGIPVVEEFAQVEPNFALQIDVNLGLLFAF